MGVKLWLVLVLVLGSWARRLVGLQARRLGMSGSDGQARGCFGATPAWSARPARAQSAARPRAKGPHGARTQHLWLGCACSRQTKLLAHGRPSAIWGGRCPPPAIGRPPAERFPEIDMRPAPAKGRQQRAAREGHDRGGGLCSTPTHWHRWLRSHTQRPAHDSHGDCSNQRIASTRHTPRLSLAGHCPPPPLL
ncbi:hypothetical protein T440DRAFT_481196 [Plenodomus tracheiphilus IPT5]|uniref:Secreted protein n=1 Tax=Plenodomus tracheiphilus IPT5 TaxID=1408161 RepID=A0A6A7B132_9PLEO|nr:hypothetical protein T440DRAFT_481196 [Plenodomus tracheiphilus IPT5]